MFSDNFGNTFLDRLQEISLPQPAAWTPQTVGWYLLAAAVAFGLLWLARGFVRQRTANRYRRAALAELAAIETGMGDAAGPARALTEIPALLKRTALAVFPRAEVAGLSGEAWLGFLDATAGTTDFTSGPGRVLADLPYRQVAAAPPEDQLRDLLSVSRRWIRKHRPTGGVE